MSDLDSRVRSFNVDGIFKNSALHYAHVTVIETSEGYSLELSGMIAFDESGNILSEDPKEQTLKTFSNIAKVISEAAKEYSIEIPESEALNYVTSSRADVVNLKDNAAAVNSGYAESGIPLRARSMIGVSQLPRDALVEITARAYLCK